MIICLVSCASRFEGSIQRAVRLEDREHRVMQRALMSGLVGRWLVSCRLCFRFRAFFRRLSSFDMTAAAAPDLAQSSNGNQFAITDDEAALYDRQIRLWGVGAQKKLRAADVLLIGCNGLGSEVVKTLVLAGINSVTIVDHEKVTHMDSLSNLFTCQAMGQNRALASQANVQLLNPNVTVKSMDLDVSTIVGSGSDPLSDEFKALIEGKSVVIVNNVKKSLAIRINNLIRSLDRKVLFYYTGNWGFFGFAFNDLGKGHQYVVEEKQNADVSLDGEDGPALKKQKAEEQEKALVTKTLDYVSLETALNVKAGKSGLGLTKRTSPVLILTHALLNYAEEKGSFPQERKESQALKEMLAQTVESLGVDESLIQKLEKFSYADFVFGELSPISSIVGSVVAQDVIRAVSGKETPIKNFFLFNGIDYNGLIESVGK